MIASGRRSVHRSNAGDAAIALSESRVTQDLAASSLASLYCIHRMPLQSGDKLGPDEILARLSSNSSAIAFALTRSTLSEQTRRPIPDGAPTRCAAVANAMLGKWRPLAFSQAHQEDNGSNQEHDAGDSEAAIQHPVRGLQQQLRTQADEARNLQSNRCFPVKRPWLLDGMV